MDSGGTDHIVTNIHMILDFVPIQSVFKHPNGVVSRDCVRIAIPSNNEEFLCDIKKILCVPDYSSTQTPYQSQDALSEFIVSLSRKK